ncbi:transcription elongation factor GreA [Clostridium acetobutylicum]|uniref:Transcription elongation factor GreA n=1 Tax=Clostridium acetobutylicum (strain ATCC 824 / DSM 792 / JCM 1419 / IAM 19013 / LMG 5710 / NBRC 13948 / NRRL B-527 / VKM B-1787 / 2291 / W) TaxID=272562 RepID=Q97HP4_CLOAB|nr:MULTISPECIES: transcription elongation factor GreA [Clostridium]AAK79926.1 Transcription elongation factor GreA [Clostridium acetobutylicum ATCC 824]ADZ21019.1 Transcription elongation factor GreA [Clostridium acetobutylicum EA 2018]AEI34651.1 transcription elongation factor GreA [Clostridium acetobutylicum DSM 1731]AWV79642.1 transcription elongation factor GreA [Clostridium acetobutylicum]MBC2394385.1 transcription elongation factor GreA [Clostridium acetobutylicum]
MSRMLTKSDYDKLKEEYEYRNTVKRHEIAKKKMEAAAFGDRSENAEYKAAKEEYYHNNRRLGQISRLLKNAIIVEEDKIDDEVNIGSEMLLKIGADETFKAKLVTTLNISVEDEDIEYISVDSPFGKALYKKHVGDSIDVNLPDNRSIKDIKIISIKN